MSANGPRGMGKTILPIAVHNGVSAMGENSNGLSLSGHDPGVGRDFD
jgi:hypothetical protein